MQRGCASALAGCNARISLARASSMFDPRREVFGLRHIRKILLAMERGWQCPALQLGSGLFQLPCSSRNFSTSIAAMQPLARRGDGLAITAVLHIATGVDAVDAGEHVVVRLEVAVRVGIELAMQISSRWARGRCRETWRWWGSPRLCRFLDCRSLRPVTSCLSDRTHLRRQCR